MSHRIVVLSLALLLAGCAGSPPIRHYSLVVPASATAAGVAVGGPRVEVLPVRIPAQVDLPELVLRQGTGQLQLAESELWIAPLAGEFRDALSRELVRRGARDVQGLPAVESEPVQRVRVTVRRFDSEWSRRVVIEAVWTIAAPSAAPLACEFFGIEAVDAGYEALVRGHQRLIAVLAGQILEAAARGRCPA